MTTLTTHFRPLPAESVGPITDHLCLEIRVHLYFHEMKYTELYPDFPHEERLHNRRAKSTPPIKGAKRH